MVLSAGCGGGTKPTVQVPECPPPGSGPTTVDYATQIKPIFQANSCLTAGCHIGTFSSSRFRLDTYDNSFKPGDECTALGMCPIVPGKPDSSYIVWKLEGRPGITGVRMPQDRPALSAGELNLIRQWILEGAFSDSAG